MHPTKRRLSVEIKEIAADGSFEGLLAVYNNVDLGGDMIEPGAFTKTIQEHGSEVPLLWQHKTDRPIGKLSLSDGPDALRVKGQLLMELDDAKNAYALIKARVIKGLSIGFDTLKDQMDSGVRRLKELRLWEGSIVTFPMNEAAMITSVKMAGGETKDDFNGELAQVQLQDAGFQMRCALFQALGSITWASGITRDQKVSASQITIEQFSEAFLSYLPQYLDWLAAEYGDMETMGRLQREEKNFSKLLGRGLTGVKQVRGLLTSGETKEGRKFSAATKKNLKAAHEHVKGLDDIFDALFDDEADDDPEDPADDTDDSADGDKGVDTSESKAAEKKETEPVPDHSAADAQILQIRSLIPKA